MNCLSNWMRTNAIGRNFLLHFIKQSNYRNDLLNNNQNSLKCIPDWRSLRPNSSVISKKCLSAKQAAQVIIIRNIKLNIFQNNIHPPASTSYCNFTCNKPSYTLIKSLFQVRQQTRLMSTKISDKEATFRKQYKCKEIDIKTPYGHIACLEWGHQDAPNKILCSHGWLDNAGSFERLIPFILDHNDNHQQYHIVAMDMPGVGHSSHKPPGAEYTTFANIVEMRRVAQQLGWKRLTLLAHSQGSHFSFLYACVYPEQVDTVISIDLAHPLTRQVHNWNVSIANSIEEHFKCEYHHEDDPTSNIRVPVYSEVDALKRLMDGHSNSLTRESAEVLLKRGAKKQQWGYTFNRDVRLRYLSLELRPDDDLMLQFMCGPFKPNLLIIRATRSPYHRPEETRLKYYELFKQNCPLFHDITLEGTHHLHMNTPETVALEINKFLDEVKRSSEKQSAAATISKSSL